MDETSATAMLVGTPPMFEARPDALTVTVPRGEIDSALTVEPPKDLVLDIVRRVEGTAEPERRSVNVEWARADLESVIEGSDADAITFSFDPAELDRLLSQAEVEGHGLREAAVILGIAAAAAATGATHASAADRGTGVAEPHAVVISHDEATLAQRGIDPGTVAATHDEATLAQRGIDPGTVAATHEEATLAQRGIDPGTVAATHDAAAFAQPGLAAGTVAAPHDEASFAQRGIDAGTVAATHDEATFAQRGIDAGTVAATPTATTFNWPSVDPAMAAGIAAALAAFGLAILGATFASRRQPPRAV